MKKSTDPRKPRTYKAREEPYYKAVRRCYKLNTSLTNVVEDVVEAIAQGDEVIHRNKSGVETNLTEKQSDKK